MSVILAYSGNDMSVNMVVNNVRLVVVRAYYKAGAPDMKGTATRP